jgi:hypothetical protein
MKIYGEDENLARRLIYTRTGRSNECREASSPARCLQTPNQQHSLPYVLTQLDQILSPSSSLSWRRPKPFQVDGDKVFESNDRASVVPASPSRVRELRGGRRLACTSEDAQSENMSLWQARVEEAVMVYGKPSNSASPEGTEGQKTSIFILCQ